MRDWRSVPLGVDLGATRVRVACGEAGRAGAVRLRAVGARDLPEEPALVPALLEELLDELGTRERRCVLVLGSPHVSLRCIRFPKMTWAERVRASRYEAARIADWATEAEPAVVRTHPCAGAHAVGVARAAALGERIATVRSAGLRVVGVDHDAFALRRHLGACDAIADVGAERTSLHCFPATGPHTFSVARGGATVTHGIAEELGIDVASAERRKRILGCSGAGIPARHAVVAQLASLIERGRTRGGIERIAITGNGARLPRFVQEIEDATGALAEMPIAAILQTSDYPEDVLRAAAPDWTLAAGLLDWSLAG